MVQTHLILIEGIAGTGKTTNSNKLYQIVKKIYANTIFYNEFYIPHPIHEWEAKSYPTWYKHTIENWKNLTQKLILNNQIAILESTLFQGTIGDLIERDIDEATIFDYAFQVPALIQNLNPVLIYLLPDKISSHIKLTYQKRNAGWQQKIDHFIQNTTYGENRGLYSLEGYITFIKTLKRFSDILFHNYNMPKIAINISKYDWRDYETKMVDFLNLDPS